MKTEKKKEYVVPQMETLELGCETQILQESSLNFGTEEGTVEETNNEIG